jgi:carbon monoxide dehydrogenase subunit G
MKFSGTEELPYERITVWEALHDTNVLKNVIPGCKSMELGDNGEYLVTLSLGVAAIRGEFEGKARLTDHEVPHHYTLEAEGSGSPGFVKIHMDCFLDAQESHDCLMRWECNVEAGGLIAGIGGRVLSGVAKFMAKQFFQAVKKELASYKEMKAI